jgi:hypothetical protein
MIGFGAHACLSQHFHLVRAWFNGEDPLERRSWLAVLLAFALSGSSDAQGTRDTTTYRRFKAALDAIPATDTHDHLLPFERLLAARETDRGKDANHAEGIYGATEMIRRCLAEVLAERVDHGDLREEHSLRIGRQILRDNALSLFPQLESRLWKHKAAARTAEAKQSQ